MSRTVQLVLHYDGARFAGWQRQAAARTVQGELEAALERLCRTHVPVVGATRLYGITIDGKLAYVEERAHTDDPLAPHASAALERIAG